MASHPLPAKALVALFLGATGIGLAPLFVRWSETGPVATAFYRLLFAVPVLWAFDFNSKLGRRGAGTRANDAGGFEAAENARALPSHPPFWLFALAGFCFAGDMAFWNWSVTATTVANATLLTNLAPVFVLLGARAFLGERVTVPLLLGMVLALLGAGLLVGASFTLTPKHVLGDALGLISAVFYAGYILSVKELRRSASALEVMTRSGLVACLCLGIAALGLGEQMVPRTRTGWLTVVLLALISQIGGQGLIAWALAQLTASFSSIGLLLQPVVAAAMAWLLLGERLGALQIVGSCVVLAGILTASRGGRTTSRAR